MISFPPADKGQTELFGEPDRLALLSQAAHIVVIDDEDANVKLLMRLLERAGFQSLTGLTDARELPALLVESPADLVITDLHMPGVDGFGVLDMLSPYINLERLPVLMVTGDASRDARTQALLRGAKDFVTKPFDAVEVLLRVRTSRKPYCCSRSSATERRCSSSERPAARARVTRSIIEASRWRRYREMIR